MAFASPAWPAADESVSDEPLSFGFLDERPGELVPIGGVRLHLHCRGGDAGAANGKAATVLFESGLGGNALEWSPIADVLSARVRVCTYDRAGYAWSDPSNASRDARRLARELGQLLDAGDVAGPLVLVAHSFGGLVARLAIERGVDVAALVLVDSSHEEQFARLERPGGRPMVPRNRQFVISRNEPPDALPEDIRRKLAAFGRMRKTYAATHGEMAAFRESVEQVRVARAARGGPLPIPVTVLRRGRDLYPGSARGAAKTAAWIGLQEDLATLGTPGRLVVATTSGHHVHADDPALVIREIERLLDGPIAGAAPPDASGEAVPATAADDSRATEARPDAPTDAAGAR